MGDGWLSERWADGGKDRELGQMEGVDSWEKTGHVNLELAGLNSQQLPHKQVVDGPEDQGTVLCCRQR